MYEHFNLDNNIVQNNLQLLYVTCYRYEKQWHGTRHAHDGYHATAFHIDNR